MKHITLIKILTLSSIALLCSCIEPIDETQNCGDSPPEYYYLSAAQKAIIPYSGYDTINMVSNTGDTIHCIGTGKQYFNMKEFKPQAHPSCAGYGTDIFYEAYKIEFVDSLKNIQIDFTHYFAYPNSPYLYYGRIALLFKNNNFFISDSQISRSKVASYVGNIEINSKLYYSVNKAKNSNSDTSSFFLLNKSEGILKIQLNQNEQWEVLPN